MLRPAPRGWPPAKNRLERFVQLHAAGLVDDRAIAGTFAEETVWVDASTLSHAGLSDPVACYTDRIEAGADNVPNPVAVTGADCCAGRAEPIEVRMNPGSRITTQFRIPVL